MSLREHSDRQRILGSAIGAPVGGFWSSMAIPPPRPLSWAFEPIQADVASMSHLVISEQTNDDDESPVLDRICPLWLHDLSSPGTAIVLFDEASNPDIAVPLQSTPRRLRVRAPVSVRKVTASSLTWQPLLEDGEEIGIVYYLGSDARVEVRVPGSVAVVQADYSPLCASTGICAPSSLLVFGDPKAHLESLRCLQTQLERGEDLGYLPTQECCVTPAFDRLVMRTNPNVSGERNDAARRTWLQTKAFLKHLSALTADCLTRYNENEITRMRAFELSHRHGLWRGNII
tara:strand:- start:517 stop:1380 length:864 start_codon:yes stop_codon:yes gene_type:complete